jgi:mono/diheme cytochrome c family protein
MIQKTSLVIIALLIALGAYLQASKPPRFEEGKKVYNTACLACHQADGAGVPGLNPPLTKTEWVNGDKKRLINIILKGMTQPIEIDGETYENVMPAQPTLTDQQIADVLTFVRNSFGNKGSAVTPAEVKALRK